MATFQTVKGFRHFLPEDCALRNYIFDRWHRVARAYGFVEYEGPVVEPTDLYKKKSGDEITGQLFNFITKGDEDVSLRPEVTPTLARLVAANQRNFAKPLKWYQIGSCFRYEKPQRGRTREFIQFNVDIAGDSAPAQTDAELVAFAIDTMLAFGFQKDDFIVRLSNRGMWTRFLTDHNIAEEHNGVFLQIIDKMERTPREVTAQKLAEIGLSIDGLESFMASYSGDNADAALAADPVFASIREDLSARGLWPYVKIDPGIVRGLAYYTGTVFEIFDIKHNLRAIAGGGRYDNLISLLSDGGVQMPACGFAMGDVVLTELINRHEGALSAMKAWIAEHNALDAYVVIADDARSPEALAVLQQLRHQGLKVDYSLNPAKVGKQFQAAENAKAKFAIVIGGEYPLISIKNLRTRDQSEAQADQVVDKLQSLLSVPAYGNLLA